MSLRILPLLFLLTFFFFSCKNGNETPAEKTSTIPQESVEEPSPKILTKASLDLTEYGIANNGKNVLGGLKVGDTAPDFSLYNSRGKVVNLNKELDKGPAILVFYRADWCSYCTQHLIEFKDRLNEIYKTGFTNIIAVTPQNQSYSAELKKKNRFIFNILQDAGHTVMKKYKVFYHVTKAYNEKIKENKGESIEVMNGDDFPVLCVPATYLIGQDFKIKYVHYDPDYSQRADLDELISHL